MPGRASHGFGVPLPSLAVEFEGPKPHHATPSQDPSEQGGGELVQSPRRAIEMRSSKALQAGQSDLSGAQPR